MKQICTFPSFRQHKRGQVVLEGYHHLQLARVHSEFPLSYGFATIFKGPPKLPLRMSTGKSGQWTPLPPNCLPVLSQLVALCGFCAQTSGSRKINIPRQIGRGCFKKVLLQPNASPTEVPVFRCRKRLKKKKTAAKQNRTGHTKVGAAEKQNGPQSPQRRRRSPAAAAARGPKRSARSCRRPRRRPPQRRPTGRWRGSASAAPRCHGAPSNQL